MTDFLNDAMLGSDEPDGRLSDLLKRLKLSRTDTIALLADRHRKDGVPDHGLVHTLAVTEMAIQAITNERDQW